MNGLGFGLAAFGFFISMAAIDYSKGVVRVAELSQPCKVEVTK